MIEIVANPSRLGQREEAADAFDALRRELVRRDFGGWDPYDALASPILAAIARTDLSKRAVIQGLKRLPFNVRPLVGVPPQRHTKALALATSALACAGETGLAHVLAGDLGRRAIERGSGVGWGYDFDVVTRWGRYARGAPNAIATAFCGHALLDVGCGRDLVDAACRYAVGSLFRAHGDGGYFVYYEGASVAVHNANLLLASLIFRAGAETSALETARAAVAYSIDAQSAEGSWPYGEDPRLGWVDGYHTAYNLDALRWCLDAGHEDVVPALQRGLDFYLEHLFDGDGAPRATVRRRFPVDIHAASTAIAVLAQLARLDRRALATAESVLEWTLAHMRRSDGRFAFQLHSRYRNSVPYVRWSDSHMLYALSRYLEAVRDE